MEEKDNWLKITFYEVLFIEYPSLTSENISVDFVNYSRYSTIIYYLRQKKVSHFKNVIVILR